MYIRIRMAIRKFAYPMLALLLAIPASAGVVNQRYFVGATAQDIGPQDGIFDEILPNNSGSITNNGWTSLRTAVEFDLSELKHPVQSATLTVDISNHEGQRNIQLHSYIGDGQIDLGDFELADFVGGVTITPDGTQRVVFDVTTAVKQSVSSGSGFVGFNFAEEPANAGNYTVMFISMEYFPQLSVTSILKGENAALQINDDHCIIADGTVFGSGYPNMVSSEDGHVVQTNSTEGNTTKICKFEGVPNNTGSAVVYDYQDIMDYYGFSLSCSTRLDSMRTTDWKVTISTSGSATLRCKFKD